MSEITDKIESIQRELDKLSALIRPKVEIATQLREQISRAQERRAYTGKYETPMIGVQVFTKEKTIAEIRLESECVLRRVDLEIAEQKETLKEQAEIIDKIKELLD